MNGPLAVVIVGLACCAVGLAWLLTMHARGRVDLTDVVTEPDVVTPSVRRASIRKIGEAVALGATTFVVVYDSLDGANEWVFGLYVGAWVSRTLFGMLAQARAGAISAASK